MEQTRKPGVKTSSSGQSAAGGYWISLLRTLLILFGFYGMVMFWINSRPLPDRIATMFDITLPAGARNFGWFDYTWNGYVTLAKFTVDLPDLERTLGSAEGECVSEPRQAGYMPDFYVDENLKWWKPFEAVEFDGASCYRYNPNGLAPNYHVMVDYSLPGEATVYIEKYSVDAEGRRALVDD